MQFFFYALLDTILIDDNIVYTRLCHNNRYFSKSVDESNLSIVVPFVTFLRSEFDHVKIIVLNEIH